VTFEELVHLMVAADVRLCGLIPLTGDLPQIQMVADRAASRRAGKNSLSIA